MERYLKVLKSYKRFPLEMERKLLDNVQPIAVKKHEIIQPDGAVNDCLYFVERGLFHLFGEKDGKQITHRFKKEDEFIIALKFIFANAPSIGQGIEALEDGMLWQFPGSIVSLLMEEYIEFSLHIQVIVANDLVATHESMRYALPISGPDKYKQLRVSTPDLVDRVPLPYLANYINIPESVLRHLRSSSKALNFSTKRRRM